jgi:hypothetical protein
MKEKKEETKIVQGGFRAKLALIFSIIAPIFAVFFFMLFSSGTLCQADDRAKDRATLRGIQAVIVKVHSWEPEWRAELARVGLEEGVLQALIERKLEKAGIQVIPEEAAQRSEVEGTLNVRIKFVEPEPTTKKYQDLDGSEIEKIDTKKKYIYAIRINFRQIVMIPRHPDLKAQAITWQTESVGLRRLALIRDDVMRTVEVFMEAYLSENPPKKADE